MPTDLKRMTFTVPLEMEKELNAIKKEIYYSHTQSDMLRELIVRGIRTIKAEKEAERK